MKTTSFDVADEYAEVAVEGEKVVLTFTHAGSELAFKIKLLPAHAGVLAMQLDSAAEECQGHQPGQRHH